MRPPGSLNDQSADVAVQEKELRETVLHLRDRSHFGHLSFVTAVDRMGEGLLEMVYCLYSYETGRQIIVRVMLDRAKPEIDTVSDIYRTAEWHEREAAEMFGISFRSHPDPSRLLLPDDIAGFPLRKDFKDDFTIPLPSAGKE